MSYLKVAELDAAPSYVVDERIAEGHLVRFRFDMKTKAFSAVYVLPREAGEPEKEMPIALSDGSGGLYGEVIFCVPKFPFGRATDAKDLKAS